MYVWTSPHAPFLQLRPARSPTPPGTKPSHRHHRRSSADTAPNRRKVGPMRPSCPAWRQTSNRQRCFARPGGSLACRPGLSLARRDNMQPALPPGRVTCLTPRPTAAPNTIPACIVNCHSPLCEASPLSVGKGIVGGQSPRRNAAPDVWRRNASTGS